MTSIVLVGFMGSGKTTVAKALQTQSNLPLVDMDQLIINSQGQSISELFERYGESGFRRIETACLRDCLQTSSIISTGGGVVLSSENRQLLNKSTSHIIWLKAEFETMYQRIIADKKNVRPIVVQRTKQELEKIENDRRALYEDVATFIVEVDRLSVNQIVNQIKRNIID
ncbi:shikimate kinase [Vagococcus xieshaowenii]|uniref:Shikimate kinase n=1 Tax=Vagococcus xieshaowenii TaxID=2562451 RepID=A0AAJ5JLQ2_9ENTE|nr:shikimate kinase [Vagococcus xieshaowenii]QCA28470.1 shikimate kinase [Vagococcus xieshaowenii]TFZ42775.1 shikimate kinase [Vagococcus xieshaowenii]